MRVAQLTLDAIERQATDEVNGNSSKIDEDFIAEKAKIPSKDDCKKSWGRVQSAISADLDGYDKKITKAYEDRLSSTPESYVRWARIRSRQVIAQRVGGIV